MLKLCLQHEIEAKLYFDYAADIKHSSYKYGEKYTANCD